MVADLRSFLDLQSDQYLIALKDKLSADILANNRTTSFSYVGKSGTTSAEISTSDLAQQLADVFRERGLEGATPKTRMTAVRFV